MGQVRQVGGKDMSYNNWTDWQRVLELAVHMAAQLDVNKIEGKPHFAFGVKHGNACGAAIGTENDDVIFNLVRGDLDAIFGGIVITNFEVGDSEAWDLLFQAMPQTAPGAETFQRRFLEAVIAPRFTEKAKKQLAGKLGNIRLLELPELANLGQHSLDREPLFRYMRGGFLLQPNYTSVLHLGSPYVEVVGSFDPGQEAVVLLADTICFMSNSNTITVVDPRGYLIGNGTGQQSRVAASELAVMRAKKHSHHTENGVAASDGPFPLLDGLQRLTDAGVKTVVTRTGMKADEEIRQYCAQNGITLITVPNDKHRGFSHH